MDLDNFPETGSPSGPGEDVVVSALSTYTYEATGGLEIAGRRVYRVDIEYDMEGGLVLIGGDAGEFSLPYKYFHVATGGVTLGGVRYAVDYCYVATGGITLTSPSGLTNRTYTPTGGVNIGGGVGSVTTTGHLGGVVRGSFYLYYSFSFYNIRFGGQANYRTSGSSSAPSANFNHVGLGGIRLDGDATITRRSVPIYVAGGGVTVGSATGSQLPPEQQSQSIHAFAGFRYVTDGSVFIGGFGNSPASTEVLLDRWFLWNVIAQISIEQQFEWSLGDPVLFFFQVNSCCKPTNCEMFILDDGSQCQNTQMITTILAPNVEDVCRQLTERDLNVQICQIRQFTRAAYKSDQQKLIEQGIPQDCNEFVDLEFCNLPACLDLCVDFDVNIDIKVDFGTEQRHIATGGIVVFGSAEGDQIIEGSGSGSFGISGSAIVSTSSNAANASSGGLVLGGTSLVQFASWSWIAVGGLVIGGSANGRGTLSTNYSYVGGGDGGVFRPTSTNCFEDDVTAVIMTDMYGSLILNRQSDRFIGCRQMMLSSDDYSNTKVSAPVRFTFYCGDNPSTDFRDPGISPVYKLKIGYPTQSPSLAGAKDGYTCGSYGSAPYRSDANPPQTVGECLLASNPVLTPIQADFSFPCFGCYGYGLWAGISYTKVYGIGYAQPSDFGVHITQVSSPVPPGLLVGGTAKAGRLFIFRSNGAGATGPTFAAAVTGGTANATQGTPAFQRSGSGGAIMGASASISTNRLGYTGVGGPTVAGRVDIALGRWFWSNTSFQGISTSGSANARLNGVQSQSVSVQSLPDAVVDMGAYAAITFAQVRFNTQSDVSTDDGDAPTLGTSVETIKTKCDCNDIATLIHMRHNLGDGGRLKEFLQRNNLALPPVVPMSYNAIYNAWQANLYYEGYSPDGVHREVWNLVFDWQCTTLVGGTELGSPVWKFGAYIVSRNVDTGEDYDTRILMTFSKLGPCQNGVIRFEVSLNTETEVASTDPRHQVYSSLVHDGIGMFRSRTWRKRPIFVAVLSLENDEETATRIPYNPIFPESQ